MDESSKYMNWSKMSPEDAAATVWAKVISGQTQSSWRHYMAARGAALYESHNRGPLFSNQRVNDCRQRIHAGESLAYGMTRSDWNYGRALVDTIVAKIMGLDNPTCQLITTDGDYELKRQALWGDRFIEGNAHQQQGNFSNLWALGRAVATMACASTGLAAIRTEPDFVFKRVSHSLRSTLDTYIDPQDWAQGRPLSYFDVTWESADVLAEDPRWKGKKDLIMKSAETVPRWMRLDGEPDFETPMVQVVTAWRMQFGSFKGREARFIKNGHLQWDDYQHDSPRMSFFRASPLLGNSFFSQNLLEVVAGPLGMANKTVRRTGEALDLMSDMLIGVDTKKVDPSSVAGAKTVKFIKYDGDKGAPGSRPIEMLTTPIVDASRQQFADRNIEVAHQLLGTDQMHTSGKRPEGMTSGRGVRMVASLFSERHSPMQRAWRNLIAKDVARQNLTAAVEIGEHAPDWQVEWPGQDFSHKVPVSAITRLSDRIYDLRATVVSEQKNSAPDRAELANEMLANKQISPETHAVIVSETFDTPSETKGQTTERRFFAKLIDLSLNAEPEDIEDEDFWVYKYQSPPPFLRDKPGAMRQVFDAYLEAMIDDVPQFRRQVLKRCLEELNFMVTQAAQAQAATQNMRVSVDAPSVASAMGGDMPPATQGPPNAGNPPAPTQ